jgi:hypothetical protein
MQPRDAETEMQRQTRDVETNQRCRDKLDQRRRDSRHPLTDAPHGPKHKQMKPPMQACTSKGAYQHVV